MYLLHPSIVIEREHYFETASSSATPAAREELIPAGANLKNGYAPVPNGADAARNPFLAPSFSYPKRASRQARLRVDHALPSTEKLWYGRINLRRADLIRMFKLGAACEAELDTSANPPCLKVKDRLITPKDFPGLCEEAALLWHDLILSRLKLRAAYIEPAYFALRDAAVDWREIKYPIAFVRKIAICAGLKWGIEDEKYINYDDALETVAAVEFPRANDEALDVHDDSEESMLWEAMSDAGGDARSNQCFIRYDVATEVYRDGEECAPARVHRARVLENNAVFDRGEIRHFDPEGRDLPGGMPIPLHLTKVKDSRTREFDRTALWKEFRQTEPGRVQRFLVAPQENTGGNLGSGTRRSDQAPIR